MVDMCFECLSALDFFQCVLHYWRVVFLLVMHVELGMELISKKENALHTLSIGCRLSCVF